MKNSRVWIWFAVSLSVIFLTACSAQTDENPGGDGLLETGERVFVNQCASCHQQNGAGLEPTFPALAGNPFVVSADPTPVIQTVLNGRGVMPPFDGILPDQDIAGVISYVRNAWTNKASTVTVEQVQAAR